MFQHFPERKDRARETKVLTGEDGVSVTKAAERWARAAAATDKVKAERWAKAASAKDKKEGDRSARAALAFR